MTIREALRQPITLQALICLVAGIFMGMASMVVTTYGILAALDPTCTLPRR